MYGLMAGLANAYTGIQAGIDRDRERQAREQELKIRDEEQAARRADREWQTGQRQRTAAEQQRTDQLRAANAAIPTTRTVQREVGPGLSEDAAGNIYADPSQPPQTRTATAANPRFAQLRQMADNERQFGDPARAMELTALADKEMWGEASRRATALRGSSASMTPMQIAEQARRIFNEDPFPLDITDVKEIQGGGVSFTLRNKDTGETTEWTAKDRNELLSGIEAYYSPATFEENRKLLEKARLERETKLLEPQKIGPGDQVWSGGKKIAENTNPTPAELRYGSGEIIGYDENDKPIYAPARGGGAGGTRGSGKREPGPFDSLDSAIKLLGDLSDFKQNLTPAQSTEFLQRARQFKAQQPNVDDAVAARAAYIASTDPTSLRPSFDPVKGLPVSVLNFEGGQFVVKPLDMKAAKKEELTAAADAFVSSLSPEERSALIAATLPAKQGGQDARRRLTESNRQLVVAQLRSSLNGKEPTTEQINAVLRERERLTQTAIEFVNNHASPKFREQAAAEIKDRAARAQRNAGPAASYSNEGRTRVAPGQTLPPVGTPAQPQPTAMQRPGGFGMGAMPTPADRRRLADERIAQMRAEEEARVAALRESAPAEAQRLLAENTPQSRAALARLQASEAFQYLDQQTQLAVWRRVNSGT